MEDYFERIQQLMEEAGDLPDGVPQTECVEQAVVVADESQDLDLQFALRLSLAQSAFNSGQLEKTIVAVAWCFGMHDQYPDRFDTEALLDICTFAMNSLSSLPQFPCAQVEHLLDDMQRRYAQAGFSLRAVERARCFNALWMGDQDEARRRFEAMSRHPADPLEGAEWTLLFRADYLVQQGREAEAVEVARPILESGSNGEGVFCWLACFMLIPLLKLDHDDLADSCFRRAYPETRGNPNFAECVGHCLLYVVALQRDDEASEIVKECFCWALDAPLLRESFELALATWAFFRSLRNRNRLEWRGELPASAPPSIDGIYDVLAVEAWVAEFVRASADRFDSRNGNGYFASMISARLAYAELDWRRNSR